MLNIQKLTFPAKADLDRPQIGVWRNQDHNQPVKVIGEAGADASGRRYVKIEGSDTAIPEDEVEFA